MNNLLWFILIQKLTPSFSNFSIVKPIYLTFSNIYTTYIKIKRFKV